MTKNIHILLVEDDNSLGFIMQDNLSLQGYKVTLATDGEQAIQCYEKEQFHLCILDIMLPKKDGFALAEYIRAKNQQIPIIFLTAKSLKEDRIRGFKVGADDYITKPFSIEELLLRIEVILKRSGQGNSQVSQDIYLLGKYQFDYKNLQLVFGQEKRDLTQMEANLLKLLADNKNRVLERDTILNLIWNQDDYFTGRSLDVFISRLRKYLSKDTNIEISNVHRVGFKFIIRE
ncbi:MAG: response regulator transcription factor [Microscillaceae bacterium]|nr:response regulator transcription factor [Microscillaceae bacterium]MDW8460781.1 response regulator transcription factor [Cytophagales bacterium]